MALRPEEVYDPRTLRAAVDRAGDALAAYLRDTASGDGPLAGDATASELAARVAEPLPRAGRGVDAALDGLVEFFVGEAHRLAHPRYVGHQVSPPLPVTAAVDLVSSGLNNGAAVWEMSPAGTVLEHLVLAWFAELVGWSWPATPGAEGAGGTFVDGGTLGNLTALAAARAAAYPRAWEDGFDPSGAAIVCADTAHYCMERAAGTFGLGRRGLFRAETRAGRLEPEAARAAIARARAAGREPFVLVGCAGSTPVGALDDLAALADLAHDEGLWFHVDAAHGGSFLLSRELGPRLGPLARADSVTIDLHKMMFQPISTAMVLVRDARRLRAAFQAEESYLFHAVSGGAAWDLGGMAFQCSRRVDAVRAWVSLVAYGADGLAALQERCVTTARAAADAIAARPALELALVPDTNIVCFRHRPADLEGAALDEHNELLRERLVRGREAYVTATRFGGVRWLRFTFINPRTTLGDAEHVLDLVERLGAELAARIPPDTTPSDPSPTRTSP